MKVKALCKVQINLQILIIKCLVLELKIHHFNNHKGQKIRKVRMIQKESMIKMKKKVKNKKY
jgi:hypothetical protein